MMHQMPREVRYKDPLFEELMGSMRQHSAARPLVMIFTGAPAHQMQGEAAALAKQLGKRLHPVGLKDVAQKFIGETEKNLKQIFARAASAQGILFFDEADALFGQRSGVRDSHDRYANLETSHLLEAVERHRGITILTTNVRSTIDAVQKSGRGQKLVVRFPPR
jgi:SpoVK/Ycf46/Vps4 family AAA+-type ATPase